MPSAPTFSAERNTHAGIFESILTAACHTVRNMNSPCLRRVTAASRCAFHEEFYDEHLIAISPPNVSGTTDDCG
jgi:hypothetical protein